MKSCFGAIAQPIQFRGFEITGIIQGGREAWDEDERYSDVQN